MQGPCPGRPAHRRGPQAGAGGARVSLEHLEEHFFDADLPVGKLEREGRVDHRLHTLSPAG